jgi:tetratricopeptide (TPR) repeat protein
MIDPVSSFLLGYAGKKGLDSLLSRCFTEDLPKQLRQVIREWASALPSEICVNPEAVFPDVVDLSLEGSSAVQTVRTRLGHDELPTMSEWKALIMARRDAVRRAVPSHECMPFYSASDEKVRGVIDDLAKRIDRECIQDPRLNRAGIYTHVLKIEDAIMLVPTKEEISKLIADAVAANAMEPAYGTKRDHGASLPEALRDYAGADDPRGLEVINLLQRREQDKAKDLSAALLADAEATFSRLSEATDVARKRLAKHLRDHGAITFLSDPHAAAIAYEKALAVDPIDPIGWRDLGRIYQWLHRLADAQGAFKKVVHILPDGLDILIQANDASTARDRFDHWRDKNEDLVTAYLWSVRELVFAVLNLAEIAHARADLANATIGDGLDVFTVPEYLIQRAFALNGVLGSKHVEAMNSENLEVLARMAVGRGDLPAAERYLTRSLAINDDIENDVGRASNLNNLGLICGMRGDRQEAEEYLMRSLAITEGEGGECFQVEYWEVGEGLNSSSEHGHIIDVPVKYREEQKHDGDKVLRKMLALKALSADAHGNLGILARERGDLAAAELAFQRALELHSEVDNKQRVAMDRDNLSNDREHAVNDVQH